MGFNTDKTEDFCEINVREIGAIRLLGFRTGSRLRWGVARRLIGTKKQE